MNDIKWKTCPHCNIAFQIDTFDWKSTSLKDHPEVFCTMCNMNYNGDEKKDNKK